MAREPGVDIAIEQASRLTELGRPEAALAVLGPLIAAYPDDIAILLKAAAAYLAMDGRSGDALRMGRRAAELDPDEPQALLVIAMALSKLGRAEEAVAAARAATVLAPSYPGALLALAGLLTDRRGTRAEAIDAARRAVAITGEGSAWAYVILGRAYLAAGRTDQADAAAREALRVEPLLPAAHQLVGLIEVRRGRLAEAVDGLATAISGNPLDRDLRDTVWRVFTRQVTFAHLVLWVARLIQARVVGDPGRAGVSTAGLVAAAVTVAALAVLVVPLNRALRGRRGAYLRGFLRESRLSAAWAGILVPVLLLVCAAPLVPPATAAILLGWALGLLVLGVLLSWGHLVTLRAPS